MPTRSATTRWSGSLEEGSGRVELTSSGVGTFDVSFPRRAADEAGGVTSPEELVAAAHTSCYAMQFSALAGRAGGTVRELAVGADVSLGPDPDGGFRLTRIVLSVRAGVDGLDAEKVRSLADEAKATCPISKALAAVPIEWGSVEV